MTSYDVIRPTSLGTGVARTSIGTNNKPSESATLIEFAPYQAPTGAVTAGQSFLTQVELTSSSVKDILPKRICMPPIQAGLGPTVNSLIPILEAYECNTPLTVGANDILEVFGQAQVANTVAPVLGCELHYSDARQSGPQMYYEKPDNETAAGTAATSVVGNTITINGGTMLQILMAELAAATVTASESYISDMAFNSPNFNNSQNMDIALQPLASGLSTDIGIYQAKGNFRKNVGMGMKSSCVITPQITISEALAGNANFIAGVGYLK